MKFLTQRVDDGAERAWKLYRGTELSKDDQKVIEAAANMVDRDELASIQAVAQVPE